MIVQAPVGDLRDPAVFRAANDEFLLWDAFVAGKPRLSLAPLVLTPARDAAARATALAAIAATEQATLAAFSDAREAAKYGFSKEVLSLARASFAAADDAQLARVDLLWTGDRFVACEVNADCPGGHNETVGLPTLTRRAGYASPERLAGLADPTEVVPALVARIGALYKESAGTGIVGLVYATAYAEDLQICAFLERELKRAGLPTRRLPVTAIASNDAGDLCAYGRRIDVLYRYFPVEYMEGLPQVGVIADAIRRRRVRTIASFREAFAQSKRAFARAGLSWSPRPAPTAPASRPRSPAPPGPTPRAGPRCCASRSPRCATAPPASRTAMLGPLSRAAAAGAGARARAARAAAGRRPCRSGGPAAGRSAPDCPAHR